MKHCRSCLIYYMNNSDNEYNSGKSSTVDPPGAWPRIGVREKDFVT